MQESVTDSHKKIGDILMELGYLTQEQLHEALDYQKKTKGRIGWILTTLGYINRIQLFRALAIHYRLDFRNDIENLLREIDRNLLSHIKHEEIIEYSILPYKMENNTLTVLTAYPDSRATQSFVKSRFKVDNVIQIVITDIDLSKLAEGLYKDVILDKSIYGLFYRNPEESAYSVFSRKQIIFLGVFMLFILLWVYLDAVSFIITINLLIQLFYTASIAFKLILSLEGVKSEIEKSVTDDEIKSLKDDELPVYTVLVPAYKEPEVIGILMGALKKFDYYLKQYPRSPDRELARYRKAICEEELGKKALEILNNLGINTKKTRWKEKTPEIITNMTLIHMFNRLFDYPLKKKSRNIKIPNFLLKSEKGCSSKFLMGYFDTDGCVSFIKKYKKAFLRSFTKS